jgi:hypothetical protein
MHANYQDCMAIVRKCGPPSFFVTFTSNPRWKEILDELEYGQSASDRPDLVARVFRLKLNALPREINIIGQPQGTTFGLKHFGHRDIASLLSSAPNPYSSQHLLLT